jgi:hypothetical protein
VPFYFINLLPYIVIVHIYTTSKILFFTTSGRIHGEFLRLIFFLSNKQADDYFAALGYQAHKEEFCHRRGVFFRRNRCTIGMACAQAAAMRGAPTTARRHVAAPRNLPPRHMVADRNAWDDRHWVV